MTVTTLTLAALSLLLAAAHLLRHVGPAAMLVFVVAALALIAIRRPLARTVLQVILVLACLEWLRTIAAVAQERMATHQPWLRMAVILGAVSAVTCLAAALLSTPGVRRYYRGGDRQEAEA